MSAEPPWVGILRLDTHFPRLPGDIGAAGSFRMPVRYRNLDGIGVGQVVTADPPPDLAQALTRAAQSMEADGAALIATSCGFAGRFQEAVQQQLRCPFLASSLLWLPLLRAQYGADACLGVMTFDAGTLGPEHCPPSVRAGFSELALLGLPEDSELRRVIDEDLDQLDAGRVQTELSDLVSDWHAAQPQIRAVVLECTNLSPWKAEIARIRGCPVFDLVDLIHAVVVSPDPTDPTDRSDRSNLTRGLGD